MMSTMTGAPQLQGTLGSPHQIEVFVRDVSFGGMVPSTFVARRRLRPYVGVGILGSPGTRQWTRRLGRWRLGRPLLFTDSFRLSCNAATDVLRVELWSHRRLRRDHILAAGALPLSELLSGAGGDPSQLYAIDRFVPLFSEQHAHRGDVMAAGQPAVGQAIGSLHLLVRRDVHAPNLGLGQSMGMATGLGMGAQTPRNAVMTGGVVSGPAIPVGPPVLLPAQQQQALPPLQQQYLPQQQQYLPQQQQLIPQQQFLPQQGQQQQLGGFKQQDTFQQPSGFLPVAGGGAGTGTGTGMQQALQGQSMLPGQQNLGLQQDSSMIGKSSYGGQQLSGGGSNLLPGQGQGMLAQQTPGLTTQQQQLSSVAAVGQSTAASGTAY